MMWPWWLVAIYGMATTAIGIAVGRRRQRREQERKLARSCNRLGFAHEDRPCDAKHCYLKYSFRNGGVMEGMEPWRPLDVDRSGGGPPRETGPG